jgi:hypothetical protein
MRTMEIAGNLDFDRISRVVMGKEALGLIFQDSTIQQEDDSDAFNLVRFDFHPDGRSPPLCTIQPAEDPVAAGHVQEWSGQMLIEGEVRHAILCREES